MTDRHRALVHFPDGSYKVGWIQPKPVHEGDEFTMDTGRGHRTFRASRVETRLRVHEDNTTIDLEIWVIGEREWRRRQGL